MPTTMSISPVTLHNRATWIAWPRHRDRRVDCKQGDPLLVARAADADAQPVPLPLAGSTTTAALIGGSNDALRLAPSPQALPTREKCRQSARNVLRGGCACAVQAR